MPEPNTSTPPRWSLKLLRLFIRKDFVEEVEGDMEEIFWEEVENFGIKKARKRYNWQMVKLLRPALTHNIFNSQKLNYYGMFKHNILVAFRSFMRYKPAFLINLLGLSVGLASSLLIYLWVASELNVDRFHEDGERRYQLITNSHTSNGILTNRATPALLAETLIAEFPEVEKAVFQSWNSTNTLSHGEKNLKASGHYASKDFFNVFSYTLLQGDKNEVLNDNSAILISDQLALNLFGTTTDVVGKTIEFQYFRTLRVSGVFEKPPKSSSHQFDFIINEEEFKVLNSWALNWKNNGPFTFIMLAEGTDPDVFNAKIRDFVSTHGGSESTTLLAVPFESLYLYGTFVNGEPTPGRIKNVRLFSIVALFILSIACINFMNLATARVSRRLKEIGVKKAVGATRRALAGQFLTESLLMTFIALLLAVFMVEAALPYFSNIIGKELSFGLNTGVGLKLIGLAVMIGLLAGSYPALYLSRFQPVKIFRGKSPSSWREVWLRKGLVIFQFTLSIVLIVSVLVVYKQVEYAQTQDIGFNKDNILYFESEGKIELNQEAFLEEVRKVPGVQMASTSAHSLVEGGYNGLTFNIEWTGKDPETEVGMEWMRINYDLIEMLEFDIVTGRSFSKDLKSDYGKVIFNEEAIAAMGLEDPVGAKVKVRGRDSQIVGVVKDFHFKTFHEQVGPAFFELIPDDTWLIMARIDAINQSETIVKLQELYTDFNPGFSFDYKFLEDDYMAQYASEQRVATLARYFAIMAMFISCLGLLGLAAFNVERRTKEIGIRKILGSSARGIVQLLSSHFAKMVLVAIVLAIPISYFISSSWLQGFAYRISLEWWFFALSAGAAMLVAMATVCIQTLHAAHINPVESLRNE